MRKTQRNNRASGKSAAQRERSSRRNVVVLASLLGALVLTSALLLILAPAPLTPDAVRSLFVTERQDSLSSVFETQAPIADGRWRYIFIHHSKGRAGNSAALIESTGMADHFVIGNGNGCEDGEIEMGQPWHVQQPARMAGGQPAGGALARIQDKCISICLIGDFDQSAPTASQMASLQQLVRTLQTRLGVPADAVLAFDRPGNVDGIGRRFPTSTFSSQLLR